MVVEELDVIVEDVVMVVEDVVVVVVPEPSRRNEKAAGSHGGPSSVSHCAQNRNWL